MILEMVCPSDACNDEVNRLKDVINLNADPCEDFNEFACGTFLKNAQLGGYNFVDATFIPALKKGNRKIT